MKGLILLAAAVLVGSPVPEGAPPAGESPDERGEAAFVASPDSFADATACAARLATIVNRNSSKYDRAVGPYVLARGDVRAHRVRAQGGGHEIEEFRCADAALSSRRWEHSITEVRPFTMEDIGRMSFPAKE